MLEDGDLRNRFSLSVKVLSGGEVGLLLVEYTLFSMGKYFEEGSGRINYCRHHCCKFFMGDELKIGKIKKVPVDNSSLLTR